MPLSSPRRLTGLPRCHRLFAFLATCALLLPALPLHALHVECVGNAAMLYHNSDTLLLFEQHPEIRIVGLTGDVALYRLPDTTRSVMTTSLYRRGAARVGMTSFSLEQGGYLLKADTVREVFWVFDYSLLRPVLTAIAAELYCSETTLTLSGTIPKMEYLQLSGATTTYPRRCRITYTDGTWSNDSWTDTIIVEDPLFAQTLSVGAPAVATDFCFADPLADALGLQSDSLCSPVYEPVALKANPVTITTTRGKEGETTNEVNRPAKASDLEGKSAPLEVQFRANGLNADYYDWRIYKGSDLIIRRTDAEHRYTFSEPGNYRAVLTVSNTDCRLDSVSINISINESMLLVPNVFTPNGDGANDEFRVAYRSLREFHCWIYNRWGTLVYQFSDPAKGWDGTINGQPAAEGAYYYVIRALGTDADANAKYMGKPAYKKAGKNNPESIRGVYQLSGAVNLLRGGK